MDTFLQIPMSKLFSLAIIAIITTAVLSVGFVQNATAASDNANEVGQTVSKDGTSPNQAHMQSCKQSSTASDCARDPIDGNGPYTSGKAHFYNKPN